MSIRTKLLFVFSVLAAAVLGLTLLSVRLLVQDSVRREFRRDLNTAAEQLRSTMADRQFAIGRAVELTLAHPVVAEALGQARDVDAELGLADEQSVSAGLEHAHELLVSADLAGLKEHALVVVVNDSGRLLFSSASPDAVGVSLRGLPEVAEALKGNRVEVLWSPAVATRHPVRLLPPMLDQDLLLTFALPSPRLNQRGAVLVGYRVSEVLARQAHLGHLALVALDGAVAATDPELARAAHHLVPKSEAEAVVIGGQQYLAQAIQLSQANGQALGTVVLARNIDEEVAAFLGRFQVLLLLIAAVVLALAVGGSFIVAARVSRPLLELGEAAKRVRLGDLEVQVTASSQDEVGRLAGAFNEMVEGLRQRDQIKGLFKRYLAPQVVEELLQNPDKASPGGERRVLSVLFCDLVGFTGLSERLGPEALVALLNEYLEEATRAVIAHGATLDKFIGDAVMCFWNAPLLRPEHAAEACLAALDLSDTVDRLSALFVQRGLGRIDCRIGVNTGPCVVGNIGSKEAQDYTVVGDTVNLASRLEGAAREYGVRILVSGETVRAAGDRIVARELDLVRVKGRSEPVPVYTVEGRSGAPLSTSARRYAEGLSLYRARRFADAAWVFGELEEPCARVLAARCAHFLEAPPADDWDGVFDLQSK